LLPDPEDDFIGDETDDFEDGYNDEDHLDLTSIEDYTDEF